jgi:hypothetical protein
MLLLIINRNCGIIQHHFDKILSKYYIDNKNFSCSHPNDQKKGITYINC